MYRPDSIKTGLSGLIGWRQHFAPLSFKIADSLTASSSGQYFQEFHPLVTLDNIKAIAPDFLAAYPAWNDTKFYDEGDIVYLSDKLYRSNSTNQNSTPIDNHDTGQDWTEYDAFSVWLKEKTDASILKVVRSLWDEKMDDGTAKNILESRAVFNGAGRITDIINEESNLAGFEIVPKRANGVTTKIEKIGLQFIGTGPITLYLMHSSQIEPIKTATVTRTKNGGLEWFALTDWYLPYLSDDIDAGGSWYIVYSQAAIGEQKAIRKEMDWSHAPCSTCDFQERSGFDIWSQYLEVHPFKVAGVDPEAVQLWDVSKNLYTYTSNYGLNLQLTIECDVTELFIKHKTSFYSVIGLQVAADMLREFAYNPSFRLSRTQQNFKANEILYELDGDSQGYKKSGLLHDLKTAFEAIDIDTTNYSKTCFPCGKKGVKYKTT